MPADALELVLAPATGKAVPVRRGQVIRVEQLGHGQCVDVNVFVLADRRERFDAARTRMIHGVRPTVGATLWSGPKGRRLLTIVADTVGRNDLLFPACTRFEYATTAGCPDHTNCYDTLLEAGREFGIGPEDVHDPLNLWLDARVEADGTLSSRPVSARAGDAVELLAQLDVLVVLSVCGDDLFGSSQFEIKPVRIAVADAPLELRAAQLAPEPTDGDGDGPELVPSAAFEPAWRTGRVRAREIEVELPDELAGTIEALVRSGRFGATPGEAVRAIFFHWWQETQLTPWT